MSKLKLKVLTYDQMKIDVLHATPNYEEFLSRACTMTMKKNVDSNSMSERLVKFLIDSGHTSVLEHLTCTLQVTGVSRSFLAQITRHRIMSPTSASQHYQDYSSWPIVISPRKNQGAGIIRTGCEKAIEMYMYALERGVPKEEARQILPNAMAVNMLMTWNARSLMNLFEQRCCNRNVDEMRVFANKLRRRLMKIWPLVVQETGPQCHADECKQGHMKCDQGYWEQLGAGAKWKAHSN